MDRERIKISNCFPNDHEKDRIAYLRKVSYQSRNHNFCYFGSDP